MAAIDARDLGRAHLLAIKVKEAAGKRFPLAEKALWISDIAKLLNARIPGYNIKEAEMAYCLFKAASWFNAQAKSLIPYWNKEG